MNLKSIPPSLLLGVVVAYIVISSSVFIVREYQHAIVLQFGRPVGQTIEKAGLHFKIPFIQKVLVFDKRILEWDGDPNQLPTKDKKYIRIDTTARWQIEDSLRYYRAVHDETGAQTNLDDAINGATRDVIARYKLVEVVRNSNAILKELNKEEVHAGGKREVGQVTLAEITTGREKLAKEIKAAATATVAGYGIRLIDVRIKRVNYERSVQKKVYERMISERKRIAERFRSSGQGAKAEIVGKMGRDLKEIQSSAYRDSQEIKGQADAKVTKIYADAYNRAPQFYKFLKSLETAEKAIGKNTTLLLSTDTEFLKLIKDYR